MGTFDDRLLVDQIIAGNGRIDPEDAPDNPWAIKIVEYTNRWGNTVWGVVFENESDQDRYERESEYILEPVVIWER